MAERKKVAAERTAAFQNLVNVGNRTLTAVPRAAGCSYAYSDGDVTIRLTLLIPNSFNDDHERYQGIRSDPNSLFVFFGANNAVICWGDHVTQKNYLHTVVAKKLGSTPFDTMANALADILRTSTSQQTSLEAILKSSERAARLEKYAGCQNLETENVENLRKEFTKYCPDLKFWATPSGCKADAGVSKDTKALALQFKTANEQTTGCYSFNRCTGYDGMLVVCRPIARDEDEPKRYVVVPCDQTKGLIGYVKNSPKWSKYDVPDDRMVGFLQEIYAAVAEGKKTFAWPSGDVFDISQLRFFDPQELDVPVSAMCQKEMRNLKSREAMLPDFLYEYPITQVTFDAVIQQTRVQDKVAEVSASTPTLFNIKVVKNAGNVDGRRKKGPYAEGDFDALWVFLPDSDDFFILPAKRLVQAGVLSNGAQSGKQWAHCCLPGHEGRAQNHLWTTDYYFKAPLTDEARQKVAAVLRECAANVE